MYSFILKGIVQLLFSLLGFHFELKSELTSISSFHIYPVIFFFCNVINLSYRSTAHSSVGSTVLNSCPQYYIKTIDFPKYSTFFHTLGPMVYTVVQLIYVNLMIVILVHYIIINGHPHHRELTMKAC